MTGMSTNIYWPCIRPVEVPIFLLTQSNFCNIYGPGVSGSLLASWNFYWPQASGLLLVSSPDGMTSTLTLLSYFFVCLFISQGSGVVKAGFAGDQVPKYHFPNL